MSSTETRERTDNIPIDLFHSGNKIGTVIFPYTFTYEVPICPEPDEVDIFGIKKLNPTNGRTFFQPSNLNGKKGFGFRDGDMILRGNGNVTFDTNKEYMMIEGSAPRLYVYDEQRQKTWKDVEITVYYQLISEYTNQSWPGFGIGTRSIHEIQTSSFLDVPTYYLRHTFNGRFQFVKEDRHGSSYTNQPNSDNTDFPFNRDTWYGLKFIVKTLDNGTVKLEGYRDMTNGKEGGDWQLKREFVDNGTWSGKAPILSGTSTFIRSDYVNDIRVKYFSIREIVNA